MTLSDSPASHLSYLVNLVNCGDEFSHHSNSQARLAVLSIHRSPPRFTKKKLVPDLFQQMPQVRNTCFFNLHRNPERLAVTIIDEEETSPNLPPGLTPNSSCHFR